jgi:hypothetical protein
MAPKQSDPSTTSPIDRDELRALVRRVRDTEAHHPHRDESVGRAEVVVVHRFAVSRWLAARGGNES